MKHPNTLDPHPLLTLDTGLIATSTVAVSLTDNEDGGFGL